MLDFDLDLDFDDEKEARDGLRLTERIVKSDDAISFEPSDDYADNAHSSVVETQKLAAKKEAGAIVKSARNAQKRMEANTDQSYYFTVVFLDSYQAEAFMKALEWNKFSEDSWSLDGLALAKKLGIKLPESQYAPYDFGKEDTKLSDLSFELD